MKYELTEKDEVTVLSFIGDLNIFDFTNLSIDFSTIKNKIVIDFSKATSINSDAITWLINLYKNFTVQKKTIPEMIGCNESIYELFILSSVDKLFQITDRTTQLIASANAWSSSSEGKKELAEAMNDAQNTSMKLEKMRQVDYRLINEPITI